VVTLTAIASLVASADDTGVTTFPVLASCVPLVLRRTPDAVYLVGGAAGPLGGDDLRLRVDVGAGARVRLRTSAASIALPARSGAESVLRTDISVGVGGRLEYLPEPVIVAEGARHRVDLRVTLAHDATLLLRDEIVLGRHGERGGSCVTSLRVDVNGAPLLRQEIAVSGTDEVSLGPAVLAGRRAIGSLLIVGPGARPRSSPADGVAVMPLNADADLVTALAPDVMILRQLLTPGSLARIPRYAANAAGSASPARRARLAGISNHIRHSQATPPMIVGLTCRTAGPGGPRS
jgi:urease accessory protein